MRKHVDRPHPLQLVAPARCQLLDVAGKRGRIAGDVDDSWRLEAPEPPHRLVREPGSRRVDDDEVGVACALVKLGECVGCLAGEEGGVRDPIQVGVLERAGDRFL